MQKTGITVASVCYGKGGRGFSSHGKQIMKNHGYSKVEVSSAAPENNGFFAYLQEGQSLEVQEHGKKQSNI